MEAGRVGQFCHCGCRAELKTSWTSTNPGRRFFGCPNFGRNTKKCNLFEWFDAEIADRPRIVIVGLLKKRSEMENARKHERMFWVICVIVLLYLVIFG
ncbi:hypothetical protein GQ457_03G018850 [Hibiscus cannabinus]